MSTLWLVGGETQCWMAMLWAGRAQRLVVRADGDKEAETGSGSAFGLGGPGTWFGFGPRQERNVGRLGMMGFAVRLDPNSNETDCVWQHPCSHLLSSTNRHCRL